jgi:glutamine synthetase
MQAEREAREGTPRPLPVDTLWVRFVFVDHAGITKTKAVHRDAFERRASAGVGLTKGVLALDPSGMLHAASGLSPVGECRLVPDLSTLAPLPFARSQAMVACDMTEPDAATLWDGCPRGALRRVLARLGERGYRCVASYEAEFYVWGLTVRWTGRLTREASRSPRLRGWSRSWRRWASGPSNATPRWDTGTSSSRPRTAARRQ